MYVRRQTAWLAWANDGGEESSDETAICRPLSLASELGISLSGLALECGSPVGVGELAAGELAAGGGCTNDGSGGEEAIERKSCKCSGLMSAGLAGRETCPEARRQRQVP